MGVTYRCRGLKELAKLVHEHNQALEKRLRQAIIRAARQGKSYIVRFTLPIAFRELERSLRVESRGGSVRIVADAPHAAPVETGSRPHWPPLEPLVRWVKLRGMQGHEGAARGQRRRWRGTTTAEHAQAIAGVMDAFAELRGGANDVDDPTIIARAIQRAIAARGTKPHWYMRRALPEIRRFLDVEIRIALHDHGTGIGAGMRAAPGTTIGVDEVSDMAAE